MRFLLLFLSLEIYGDFIEDRMMRRNSFKTKLVGYSLNISCDFSREKIKEIDRNHELQWIRPGKIKNTIQFYTKLRPPKLRPVFGENGKICHSKMFQIKAGFDISCHPQSGLNLEHDCTDILSLHR